MRIDLFSGRVHHSNGKANTKGRPDRSGTEDIAASRDANPVHPQTGTIAAASFIAP